MQVKFVIDSNLNIVGDGIVVIPNKFSTITKSSIIDVKPQNLITFFEDFTNYGGFYIVMPTSEKFSNSTSKIISAFIKASPKNAVLIQNDLHPLALTGLIIDAAKKTFNCLDKLINYIKSSISKTEVLKIETSNLPIKYSRIKRYYLGEEKTIRFYFGTKRCHNAFKRLLDSCSPVLKGKNFAVIINS